MKNIDLLSVKARSEKPQVVLSILLSVIIFSSPLSGLLKPGKEWKETERPYHHDPGEFQAFFNLFPEKNYPEDTTQSETTANEILEASKDTTTDIPSIHKNVNVVIW